jgi:Domain of unknown function (DUF5615)
VNIRASCSETGQLAAGRDLSGADVWEVVWAVMSARAGELASTEDDVLDLVAENTGLPVRLVRTAVRYWASYPDEVFSDEIAEQLRAKGHDVRSVVADPSMIALADDQLLARAEAMGRALVTANVKDFAPLDRHYKSVGHVHAGLVFVATRTFPQDRSYVGAVVTALDPLLTERADMADRVVFLER